MKKGGSVAQKDDDPDEDEDAGGPRSALRRGSFSSRKSNVERAGEGPWRLGSAEEEEDVDEEDEEE